VSTSRLPDRAHHVVIGAGIHGLSTAWHLGEAFGPDADVLVLDKTDVGAGASGIACGVVRNNYFQPAMRELMAHSVDLWERHAEELSYHPVGYLQVSHEAMREDMATTHEQQRAIGYDSTFVEGEATTRDQLRGIFPDWRAQGVTSVLHEHRGGYANNMASVRALATRAAGVGATIATGVRVTGFEGSADAVTAVVTDHGTVACDTVVVAVGPWVRDVWAWLDLPDRVEVATGDGTVVRDMWRYMALQESTLKVDPGLLVDAGGGAPPVVHVDSDAPLHTASGELVTDRPWGVYFKPDHHFDGVQGGAMPLDVDQTADDVAVDPYGPASPDFVVGERFFRMWTAALVHCMARFEGTEHLVGTEPSGGIGCFTPDSFPVIDRFRGNVHVIADSNHGYKMIGVGALVAEEVCGGTARLLEPFRFDRYARGALHPVSNSPFPWS
jgi:methylglutamate dehydrogenase subunit A